ncbi:MAG TPA: DNA repair exonuclease [Planctomycetes bacterium]|nr:DNA repair exonuclease [Planctomycetota bacterium]
MRLLLVGDMHLGRRLPKAVRAFAEAEGLDPNGLLPEKAFLATVDLAIRKRVKAVLFAGDLVEKMEDRFYAFPILEEGVRRLVEAGIEVLAVCGNHDVEALPRLARRLAGFRILGEGGVWESLDLEEEGWRLRVTGWSFPTRVVRENPFLSFPLEERPGEGIWIGLLHADLDGGGSPYAPVQRAQLEGSPLDAWFLGHVHKPEELSRGAAAGRGTGPFVGYLGSLQGLDAGEEGLHGPLLLELGERSVFSLSREPVASLAFTTRTLELGEDGCPLLEHGPLEDRLDWLHQRLVRELEELGEAWDVEVLGVRLRLKGRVRELGKIRKFLEKRLAERELRVGARGTRVFVDKVVDRLRPYRGLGELVQGGGPLGRLAEKLRRLEEGGEGAEALTRMLRGELGRIKGWDEGDWPPERVREEALVAGRGVLDALLQELEEGR